MHRKVTINMWLSLSFLITSFAFGCGLTMIAPDAERKSPTLINERISSQQSVGSGVSMRVLWTVSKYTIGKNALWGDKEARAMLFKPLDITATSITFDGKTCHGIIFTKENQKAKEYLESVFHIKPQTLGIAEEEVEVVKTDCHLPGFAEYLRLKDRRLVIYLNGVFFYLEPAVHY
ncbi:MAG: hypothetical protein NT022_08545 [Deltaproteobacteria bacterium]|nr:hypothetical protein [Deltaproteobacteria bacterium]